MKGFLLITALLVICAAANSQWVKTNGPEGGFVGPIFNDTVSGYLFEGGNGCYRSTDNGSTWSESHTGMDAVASPVAFIRSGGKLYAGSLDRMYVSTDNGDTWTGSTVPAQVLSLGSIGNVILAGVNVYGVYWTTDDGAHWTHGTGFQPANNIVLAIATVGTKVIASLGGKALWASNDSGKSWAASYSGTVFGASHTVNAFAFHGAKLFAACSDTAVMVSTDGGYFWKQSATGMNPRASVGKVVSNGTTLYAHVAGAYSGVDTGLVYRSTDDGTSWVSVRSDLTLASGNNLGLGTGKVFFTTYAGIFASTNSGGHWYKSNSGLTNVAAFDLLAVGTTVFAGSPGGIDRTDDGGATWTPANNGVPGGVSSLTVHDSYIFAADGNGVLRSGDNGASWAPMNNGLTGFALYTGKVASGGSNVYLGGSYGGVYVSSDNGGNWTGPGTGLPGFGGISALMVDGVDIWAGVGSNGIYHSTDNGGSWSPANTGLPAFDRNVSALAKNGSTLYAGLISAAGSSVYISTDGGTNWTSSSTGIPSASSIAALASTGSFVFAGFNYSGGGTAGGVYRTSDGGGHWEAMDQGLPTPSSITALAVTADAIYGSYLGVWKRPLSQVTGVREVSHAVPGKFSLEQNFPNPFNPATELKFEITMASQVRITIYDVAGREAATLVDQMMRPGVYEVSWNAAGHPSGVYYCRLTAGSYSETRKLVLAR